MTNPSKSVRNPKPAPPDEALLTSDKRAEWRGRMAEAIAGLSTEVGKIGLIVNDLKVSEGGQTEQRKTLFIRLDKLESGVSAAKDLLEGIRRTCAERSVTLNSCDQHGRDLAVLSHDVTQHTEKLVNIAKEAEKAEKTTKEISGTVNKLYLKVFVIAAALATISQVVFWLLKSHV